MSWNDKPTYSQLQCIHSWLRWQVPTPLAAAATDFLRKNANRGQVSREMNRIRELYYKHVRDKEEYFKGEIWKGFAWQEVKM